MPSRTVVIIGLLLSAGSSSIADDLLYRYDGDVLPYDDSAGWDIFNACEDECSEALIDGHYVLHWTHATDLVNYNYDIARPPDAPPKSLWVEWRFRSNHPKPPHSYTCDARFSLHYGSMAEVVFMYGDAAISFSGDHGVLGLDIDEFHTYRFESLDGIHYWISVDGDVFILHLGDDRNTIHYLQFGGDGGCGDDQIPNMVNEWEFVRYGTISYGEEIIACAPPGGFLDARKHSALDRFTVTFDEPNYVYIDEVTVEVTRGVAPAVVQTRRRENDGPETVEIVLDAPIPMGETTRFTFNDGVAVNVIEYTFVPGDTDGTGRVDLRDVAAFQTCFGSEVFSGPCQACDLDDSGTIGLTDFAEFRNKLIGP